MADDIAGIVLPPDVSVAPLTVITYPEVALVLAAICDVAVAVAVGEKSWLKSTAPSVAVVQSGMPPPVVPIVSAVQNTSDSGMVPLTVITRAVLAATVPVSTGVAHASSEYVVMRRKKVSLMLFGFSTLPNTTVWAPVGAAELPVFFRRSEPAVAVFTVQPDASPRLVGCDDKVDDELTNPVGVVHAPLAVVQAVKEADCKTVAEGTVKLNVYVVVASNAELPSVILRAVI